MFETPLSRPPNTLFSDHANAARNDAAMSDQRQTHREGELGANKLPIHIGSRTASVRFLMGAVDEVRLYNRALSEAEIVKDLAFLILRFIPTIIVVGE